MFEIEILIIEFRAIDRLSTRAIARSEISSLDHELLDDTVETGAFVGERLPGLANTLLSGTESSEILSGFGNYIVVELEDNSSLLLLPDGDIEEYAAAFAFFCHFEIEVGWSGIGDYENGKMQNKVCEEDCGLLENLADSQPLYLKA